MIVLIEGCDKTGKTTLQKRVHEATGYLYTIFDRGFVSSWVYNRLFRREEYILEDYLKHDKFLSKCFLIIYLYADKETIKERFEKDQEDFINEDQIQDILDIYQTYGKFLTNCKWVEIDTSLCDEDETLELAIKAIEEYKDELSI